MPSPSPSLSSLSPASSSSAPPSDMEDNADDGEDIGHDQEQDHPSPDPDQTASPQDEPREVEPPSGQDSQLPGRSAPKAPRPTPCSSCLDLAWKNFPSDDALVRLWGRTEEAIRVHCARLPALITAKKRGCQLCFAIYRAIELFGGIDCLRDEDWTPVAVAGAEAKVWARGRSNTRARGKAKAKIRPLSNADGIDKVAAAGSQVFLVLRNSLQPVEIFAYIRHKQPKPDQHEYMRLDLEIFTESSKPSPWPAFRPARAVAPNLHSSRREKLVRGWLEQCESSHATCLANRVTVGPPPPKRLLDLGKNPRNNGVRLVDVEHWAEPVRYAAAVLPWLGRPVHDISFHGGNAAKLRAGLPWRDVAQGVRDVLLVAHEQGLRYVWVDCMCIMVDDMADRIWHIDRVDRIFGQCHLAIAIASTRHPSEHVLGRRELAKGRRETAPRTAPIRLSKQGKEYTVYARVSQFTTHLSLMAGLTSDSPAQFWTYSSSTPPPLPPTRASSIPLWTEHHVAPAIRKVAVESTLLSTRAWTFEQLLLSPRVLWLHCSELAWECATCTACECAWMDRVDGGRHLPQRRLRRSLQDPKTTAAAGWDYVERNYHRKDIVVPSWRLWSLAGLARRWHEVSNQGYFGGIFASDNAELAENLLWDFHGRRLSRGFKSGAAASSGGRPVVWPGGPAIEDCPRRYHDASVPSWSWASMVIRGPALTFRPRPDTSSFRYPDFFVADEEFRLLDVDFVPTPGSRGDQYAATTWSLVVEGRVVLARLARHPHNVSDRWPLPVELTPASHANFPSRAPEPLWPSAPVVLPSSGRQGPPGPPPPTMPPPIPGFRSASLAVDCPALPAATVQPPPGVRPGRRALPQRHPSHRGFQIPPPPPGWRPPGLALQPSPEIGPPPPSAWTRRGAHPSHSAPSRRATHAAARSPAVFPPGFGMPRPAVFHPDCGAWLWNYAELPAPVPRRPVEHSYAYLLLLGRSVERHRHWEPFVEERLRGAYTGLVLRRTPSKVPGRMGGMERIGTFSISASLGFFDDAQVQQLRLV